MDTGGRDFSSLWLAFFGFTWRYQLGAGSFEHTKDFLLPVWRVVTWELTWSGMLELEGALETSWPAKVNCFKVLVISIVFHYLNFIIKEIEFLGGAMWTWFAQHIQVEKVWMSHVREESFSQMSRQWLSLFIENHFQEKMKNCPIFLVIHLVKKYCICDFHYIQSLNIVQPVVLLI